MNVYNLGALQFSLLFFLASVFPCNLEANKAIGASMALLLAAPEGLDGKYVQVSGVLGKQDRLFLEKDSARFQASENAVRLEFADPAQRAKSKIKEFSWVRISGTFKAANSAPGGDYDRLIVDEIQELKVTR